MEKLDLVLTNNKEMIYFIHTGIHLITVANVLNGPLDEFLGLRPYYTAQRDTKIILLSNYWF